MVENVPQWLEMLYNGSKCNAMSKLYMPIRIGPHKSNKKNLIYTIERYSYLTYKDF